MQHQIGSMEYPWYLAARVAEWRSRGAESDALSRIVVMNHPEAVVAQESVDFDLLRDFADDGLEMESRSMRSGGGVVDVLESLKVLSGGQDDAGFAGDDMALIDKFLEVKDLRIVVDNEEPSEDDMVWERHVEGESYGTEDDAVSEELAQIYLKQGLYDEAKRIYNRLFLLYSEKSVYFATQIENLESILQKEK